MFKSTKCHSYMYPQVHLRRPTELMPKNGLGGSVLLPGAGQEEFNHYFLESVCPTCGPHPIKLTIHQQLQLSLPHTAGEHFSLNPNGKRATGGGGGETHSHLEAQAPAGLHLCSFPSSPLTLRARPFSTSWLFFFLSGVLEEKGREEKVGD